MNKTTVVGLILTIFILSGCRGKTRSKGDTANHQATINQSMKHISRVEKQGDMRQYDIADKQRIADFVPKGYKLFEKIPGNLNKDGFEDRVLITRVIRKDGFVRNSFDKVVDRDRRDIIVLFTEKGGYKLASRNYNCFSSENKDGGNYFSPESGIIIEDGKLYLHCCHGRYGYWEYYFRYQNSDFMLIGYEASHNRGPIVLSRTSINFLTGVEYDDEDINAYNFSADSDGDSGVDEVFKRIVVKLKKKPLMKFSEIENFDELRFE